MAKLQVIDLSVYRLRYAIGYFVTAIVFIGLLVIAGLYIVGGLSEAERQSASMSTALSLKHFAPMMAVDIPYYLLQKAVIYLFGFSAFSIKLPSILLGVITAIGLLFLLKVWFKQNVAILAALVGLTAGPFLLAALSGTPGILYIFWPTWILLSASMLTHNARFRPVWKIILFSSIAASLYTPLSIYILLPLGIVSLLHPHIRHTLNNLRKQYLVLALLIGGLVVAPLVYCIVKDRLVALALLGIPSDITVMANLIQLKHQYLGFIHPTYSHLLTPVYGLPLILLAVMGVYRIITTKYTAKSYILIGWLLLLVPILVISPQLVGVTFVPLLILVGYGIDLLIRSWYRLFPKNPYARVAGLVPLAVLIIGLTLSGINRFTYGYLYASTPDRLAASDLTILQKKLPVFMKEASSVSLYVSDKEMVFYQAATLRDPRLKQLHVTTELPKDDTNVIASHDTLIKPLRTPDYILVNSSASDADRFYVYKKDSK